MTTDECAAELYELVVVKGRYKGERHKYSSPLFGNGYDDLPGWMKEMWQETAKVFAEQWNFGLDDS